MHQSNEDGYTMTEIYGDRRPISEATPISSLSALHLSHARESSPLLPPRADRTTITSDAEPHHLSLFSLHVQNSFHSQDTYMAPSSRLRPRSALASARLSTDIAPPPTDVISSPCIPTPSSHADCNSVGSTSRRGRGPTKGFRSERARAKTGGKLLVQFKNNVPIGINASDFMSEIGLQVRNVAPVRGVRRWKEIPADVRQVIKARTKYEVVDYDTSDDVRA
ncbi:hypothetical protein CKAN_01713200 [Cinnamomum micranthum f. kanehirae]|uniref:Uncharacterized protein n=1 Tax=Cinnamomum micranthum f. kanehirae TaxID=337451 RepID=A0A3S4PBF9_9MAGN|nr:hypothetical protein CKAN_01713200 [Cinnamomum micranthum f. kanehirae]